MSTGKKVVLVVSIVLFVGVIGAIGSVIGVFWWYGRGVAEIDQERLRNYRPPQVTRIYAADGETLIGESFTQRRTFIPYGEIPSHVENAFLAAEDADFYKHEGMDYMGMVRALIVNVKAGQIKQGASTITQQVVKIFLLTPERSFERKVQELILARRLEDVLSKQEILELYLNEIYLGHGRYGIEEAAQFYFGKSVRDIDLGQAALLATLPKAPGRDSPHKKPDKAKERQIYVLRQMVGHGFATPNDAQKFIDAELDFIEDAKADSHIVAGAEEFADEAIRQLQERYGDDLDTLGARVTTTVDMKVQRAARAGLIASLDALDERQGYARFAVPAEKKRRKAARNEVDGGVRPGRVFRAELVATPDGVTLPDKTLAGVFGDTPVLVRIPDDDRLRDPNEPLAEQFPVGAVTTVSVLRMSGGEGVPDGWVEAKLVAPQSAVMVADTETGNVLAMIGGYAYERGDYNRALRAERQPGSSFKPFVYGAALATKRYSAATLVDDSPAIYEKWRPTNYLKDVYQGKVRLRYALQKSINTIAIKLIDDVGFAEVHQFAEAAGIPGPLPEHLSLALGTKELRPFDMLQGYLTLARGGRRIAPRIVTRIEIPGQDPWEPEDVQTQALPEDVVFVLTSMMTSVVQAGTGTGAKELGRPVAGKTGTSDAAYDAWFCGFTPDKVAVAWVGFDQPRPLGSGETGGKAAIPVWLSAMKAAESGPIVDFVPPPSVVVRRIDAASGLLAPTVLEVDPETGEADDMKTLDEYFVQGTEPIEEATPAALPADDVLLGLYDDEASGEDDDAPADPDQEPANDPPKVLPSIDDIADG
mgnify:CR=1 FL=1